MDKTKKLTMLAMLCAISLVSAAVCRIPIVPAVGFITYDPKDIIITIGAYIFGPTSAIIVSFAEAIVEMLTFSSTGLIGLIMNFLSSTAFAYTAGFFYKKKHSMKFAVGGLVAGTLLMSALMLLWNYIITPIFMGVPREQVVPLLIPAILPVNILKGGINSAVILLIYKPVVTALRKANLIPQSGNGTKSKFSLWGMVIGLFLLATCILAVYLFNKG